MSETVRKPHTWDVRPSKAPPQKPTAVEHDFMLIVFKCGHCGGTFVAKGNPHIWRDTLRCKCGHQVIVEEQRQARGKCKKCRSAFYNMIIVNDLKRIRCRNCSSDIDLFIGRDGKFTA